MSDVDNSKRTWMIATGCAGAVGGVAVAVPFVKTFSPSERALAAGAAVEVDIGAMKPGEKLTVEWRGKPVWIVRRTPQMLEALQGHDDTLADPRSAKDGLPEALRNDHRSLREDVFVAVGICTHLGCSPTAVAAGSPNPSLPADWPGGFFCPCHGSTFDGAGRVHRNKPAPTNLEIPPHRFVADTRLVIGDGAA